ncbi:hypothetical protein [Fodinicola feengrottensis]|uniref:hypothetical protein n=1 Tax=Fodinicola feengrottensis TaxID=435914 RepID=UPI0024433117|nr:hypothetical protein [Fodinicola feengrottensis]
MARQGEPLVLGGRRAVGLLSAGRQADHGGRTDRQRGDWHAHRVGLRGNSEQMGGVRSRRRRLGEGPTTPATVDFATERQAPATTDSQAYLAYLAWRAGHLGQASRLLLMPSRLQAARDREAFRVDVSLATIYLFDSMESLKSLSEYVESVGAGEKGGELR